MFTLIIKISFLQQTSQSDLMNNEYHLCVLLRWYIQLFSWLIVFWLNYVLGAAIHGNFWNFFVKNYIAPSKTVSLDYYIFKFYILTYMRGKARCYTYKVTVSRRYVGPRGDLYHLLWVFPKFEEDPISTDQTPSHSPLATLKQMLIACLHWQP